VKVTLTGIDIGDHPVNLETVTGPDGSYQFSNLLPSKTGTNYTVTETQPRGFFDGQETLGDQGGSISANDQFSIPAPLLDYANGAKGVGNNFGERGVTSEFTSLGLNDLLASQQGATGTLATGLVFGTDPNGNVQWYINLGGWDGYVPGAKTPAGGYQVTYTNNTLPVTDISTGTAVARSLPYDQVRMRSAGTSARVTQIIGSAADFSLPPHSPPAAAGEGEGGAVVEDQQLQLLADAGAGTQYSQAVDAIFADSGTLLV